MKNIISLILTLSIIISCNDTKFIDVAPNSLTPEDALNIEGAGDKIVIAIYDELQKYRTMALPWIVLTTVIADNCEEGGKRLNTDINRINEIENISSSENLLNALWAGHFFGISKANRAITLLPIITTLEQEEINVLIGESKFLRALFYFRLVNLYGGVPLIDHVIDPSDSDDKLLANTRVSKEKIYDFIIADLTAAATVLPLKSERSSSELGRATKGAALGLLAKVNMYLASEQNSMTHWQKVMNLTDEIGTMGYALNYDTFQYLKGPSILSTISWLETAENNEESLFEVQGRAETERDAIKSYANIQNSRGNYIGEPNQEFYDAFESGDLRLLSSITKKGDRNWDGSKVSNARKNTLYNHKAYVSSNKDLNTYEVHPESNKNVRILRYADILLIRAEAANELDQPSIALDIINNGIRDRAGLSPLPASIASKEEIRMAIWKERRIELAFEHDRWFDIGRQGRKGDVMRANGKNFTDGKHDLLPIPLTQILLSGNVLEQNPGY